jgi:hypothetical protein
LSARKQSSAALPLPANAQLGVLLVFELHHSFILLELRAIPDDAQRHFCLTARLSYVGAA